MHRRRVDSRSEHAEDRQRSCRVLAQPLLLNPPSASPSSPIVAQRVLNIKVRDTALVYLHTGSRCAALLALPWLINHFLLRSTYLSLFAVGFLSAVAYAIPVWWLEFDGVDAQKIVSSFHSARRLLSH